jgi:hypothetical protein
MSVDGAAGRGGAGSDEQQWVRQARAAVAARAQALFDAKRADDAFALVEQLLDGLDPHTMLPEPGLADAAVLYARTCLEGHDETRDVPWARYAVTTRQQLYGPAHELTCKAMKVLAWVYEVAADGALSTAGRAGFYRRAADVHRLLVDVYEQLSLPVQAVHARVRLAMCGHAAGGCGEAVRLAGWCWQGWRRSPDRLPQTGCEIAAVYASMLDQCGRSAEARAVEREARELLPVDYRPGLPAFALAVADLTSVQHAGVCARHLTPETMR